MLSLTPGCSKAGFAVVLLAFALAGCGGGGSGSTSGVPIDDSPSPQVSVATGSVNLSWDAPRTRVNGEQLSFQSEIAGYVVHYGQDRDDLENAISVECRSVQCEQTIAELEEGSWYFAVQTRDANGFLSELSQVVQKNI